MNDFQIHDSAFIDEGVHIGSGTYIWHFCHVMEGAYIVALAPIVEPNPTCVSTVGRSIPALGFRSLVKTHDGPKNTPESIETPSNTDTLF